MSKKRFLITALVLVVLAALVYLQVRTWKKFDWHRFFAATQNTSKFYLVAGVALVYADYVLRAVRWKILLRPVCEAKTSDLVAPTMIGFAGLALLGRPGEFIRPYLIARKTNLSMASQLAVWTVERIFDTGAFALIMAVNILGFKHHLLKQVPAFKEASTQTLWGHQFLLFNIFEGFAISLVIAMALVSWAAFAVRKNPSMASKFFVRVLGRVSPKFARSMGKRVLAFGEGLNTVKDTKSFFQLSGLSVLIWLVIGFAYMAVTHAYHLHRLSQMSLSSVFLLTAASVVGGVLQLPVVGGGSQLATIGMLRGVFNLSPELATSCGMMLWLVTFMSVAPVGLAMARSEHVSLTQMEHASMEEEERALQEAVSEEESGDRESK
jgi:uncharacterized protein (TIRG00374 family)